MKIDRQGLIDSNCRNFGLIICLFDKLKKDLVFKLRGRLLTVSHYIVYQFKNVVKDCLFANFEKQFKYLDSLNLFFRSELCQCLGQWSGFVDKNLRVILFHPENTSSFSESSQKEIVNGKVYHFVHNLLRGFLKSESRVLTVRRANLTLIGD